MNRNYWPLGIFLLAMVVVGLIFLTIKTAVSNPVELTRMCQMDSEEVDENINAITKKRQEFEKKYIADFEGAILQSPKEFKKFFLRVKNKENGKILTEGKVTFFLTRPHTTKEDRKLGSGELVDGLWESPIFSVENLGRYEAQALIEVGEDSMCLTREYMVKEK